MPSHHTIFSVRIVVKEAINISRPFLSIDNSLLFSDLVFLRRDKRRADGKRGTVVRKGISRDIISLIIT